MIDRNQIHQGMVVRGSNGKKSGRVLRCTDGSFVVEKRLFLVAEAAYD